MNNLPLLDSLFQDLQGLEQADRPSQAFPPSSNLVIEGETSAIVPPSNENATANVPTSAWKIFTSTFVTIFLAELGDKTQVSTLLMSAEFHQPWVIFAGAGTALVLTTLLGVLVGQWLSSRLSPRKLDVAAGILLALISLWLVWDVVQM